MKLFVRIPLALLIVGLIAGSPISYGIPAFGKKESLNCSSCHSALPALNGYGRNYKLSGYRINEPTRPTRPTPRSANTIDPASLFPISAGIILRPYDKKGSGVAKNRVVHEIELMIAGTIAENISGFLELEAEDEDDFEIFASVAQGTYSVNPAINIQFSRAPTFYFDPFNSYTNSRRSTINRNAVIDQSFGGADNNANLRSKRQNLTAFGRIENFFYGLSYSGVANDNEGKDADTFVTRLAYEFSPTLMLGGMMVNGNCSRESGGGGAGDPCFLADREYSRMAIDAQWTALNDSLTLNAVYMSADDDLVDGIGEESNDAFYIQGFYNFLKDGEVFISPVIRYDNYEVNNGMYQVDAWTFGVSNFIHENIKLRSEYSDRRGEGPVSNDDRFTLQVDAYF